MISSHFPPWPLCHPDELVSSQQVIKATGDRCHLCDYTAFVVRFGPIWVDLGGGNELAIGDTYPVCSNYPVPSYRVQPGSV